MRERYFYPEGLVAGMAITPTGRNSYFHLFCVNNIGYLEYLSQPIWKHLIYLHCNGSISSIDNNFMH